MAGQRGAREATAAFADGVVTGRGTTLAGSDGWPFVADRQPAVWQRHAPDGRGQRAYAMR